MIRQLFILLFGTMGLVYSQQSTLFPEIVISAPGLVPQKLGPDKYVMVIDTTRKVEITHVDSSDQSPIAHFIRYFTSKLNYNNEVVEQGYSGTIYADFNIDSNGHLVNIKILRKLHPVLDDMIVKILEACPPFNPKNIDQGHSYTLPVKFRIMD